MKYSDPPLDLEPNDPIELTRRLTEYYVRRLNHAEKAYAELQKKYQETQSTQESTH